MPKAQSKENPLYPTIEKLLRAFPWSGVATKQNGVKVLEDIACSPNEEGG